MTQAPTSEDVDGAMLVLVLMVTLMVWRMANGRRVVGRMRMIVFSTRHAVRMCLRMMMCAIRPNPSWTLSARSPAGYPVAPTRRKWHGENDGSKATKGRHMARELVAGARAPAFTLARDGGTRVSLKDFKGRKLVLYFYPKADTPGCTKEALGFSKLRAAFAKAGTDILGVSADPVPAQDKFKAKHKLTIALGSDESKAMLEAYGAWGEKSMYGRKFMGVIRKTFLIDEAGRVARVWPKVKVEGHAEEVLEAARSGVTTG